MKQTGSILIFMMWILILLGVLTASVGLRSRLGIKLSEFYNQRLSNSYLMNSGVNLAAYLISEDDDPQVDSRLDNWYHEPKELKNFALAKQIQLSIADEESKINLNKVDFHNASTPFLKSFFGILAANSVKFKSDPKDLIAGIFAWREQTTTAEGKTFGYEHKHALFETVDELRLVQNMTPEDFETLRPFFTVYGRPFDFMMKMNINTVHDWILKALFDSLPENFAGSSDRELIYNRIQLVRNGDLKNPVKSPPGFFQAVDISSANGFLQRIIPLSDQSQGQAASQYSPALMGIASLLIQYFTVDSQFFSVRVETKKKDFSYAVDAILGTRQQILVKISKGNYNLQSQLNNVLRGYPFEILYWNEQVTR